MKDVVARVVGPIVVGVFVVVCWQWGSDSGLFPVYILPSPITIAGRLWITAPVLVVHVLVTANEIICGFVIAVVVGIFLACLLAYVRLFDQVFYPWLVFVQVLPKVALGPLIVVWLGIGFLPKAIISFLLAFFPIMIDTVAGLKSVQRDQVFLLRSMGAGYLKRFWYFQLPHALPHIFASLKVGITLAAVGAIVGEFIGADKGLGYVLITATGTLDTVLIFVALAWISMLSLVLFGGIVLLRSIFVSWHTSARHSTH